MPHYSNYGGTRFSAQPADELTGTFNALNETTNVRPTKGESISIVHPAFKTGYDTGPIGSPVELNSLDIGPVNKTADKGWWTVDGADFRDSELDALNETTNFDPRILGPISGESESDNHFTPDRGGDSLTGEGRPTKIWTTGGASTFEDRHVGDYDANDAVFSMRENVDWTAANGGPGSSYLTAKLGANSGPGGTSFMTETFEPAAGMNSFGESLNPVAELGANSGPGGTSFMTGRFDMPADNLGGSASPGGDDV